MGKAYGAVYRRAGADKRKPSLLCSQASYREMSEARWHRTVYCKMCAVIDVRLTPLSVLIAAPRSIVTHFSADPKLTAEILHNAGELPHPVVHVVNSYRVSTAQVVFVPKFCHRERRAQDVFARAGG